MSFIHNLNLINRKLFLALLFLFVSCTVLADDPSSLLKEPGVLSVCSYDAFTPISYGNGQGYEADLLKAIAQSWGVKIKFYPENVYEGMWRLPSRSYSKCDVAIGGFSPLDYRVKQGAGFSMATVKFDQSLLVRKSDYLSGRLTSYASFEKNPMKIGVVPGTSGEAYANAIVKEMKLPTNILVEYPSETELLPALLSGKIDAIARGEIGNEYQASLHKDLITIAKRNFNEKFAFALDKSNQPLINAFNKALIKVTYNNKLQYNDWRQNHNIFINRLPRRFA